MWKFPIYEINKPINWDLIEERFSWFQDMKGVRQDQIWHTEGDVFIHTKMVVEALIELPEFKTLNEQEKHILFASALLHDVEKRSTTTIEEIDGLERIVSPRHAKKGENTVRSILYKEIVTPFETREQVAKLVRLHGLPIWVLEKEDTRKEVIFASLVVNTKYLYMLAMADVLGRKSEDRDKIILKIEYFKELCIENNCFGVSKKFESNYGRYLYLTKYKNSPDYIPFDDLKFTVYMMSGLPGSGKDTYIKNNLKFPVLSLDGIRREFNISPTDKKKNGKVIQIAKEKAKEFMRVRRSFIFNATNITIEIRNKWISLFTDYGGRVKIIYIEVPYEKLISQNHNRKFKVPENIIEKMITKLEIPTPKEAHEIEYITRTNH